METRAERAASRRRRWTLTAGVALIALGSLAFNAFANFTGATSTSHTTGSGTMTLTISNGGSAGLSLASSDIAPGDTIQRAINLDVTGSVAMTAIKLTTTATTSSTLDTDATNGLQVEIDRCSVAWTEAGSSPGYTYTCSGTQSSVIASRAVIGSNLTMNNMLVSAGSTNRLRVKMTFPTTADDTFQNKSSVIQYAFSGTQRAATDK